MASVDVQTKKTASKITDKQSAKTVKGEAILAERSAVETSVISWTSATNAVGRFPPSEEGGLSSGTGPHTARRNTHWAWAVRLNSAIDQPAATNICGQAPETTAEPHRKLKTDEEANSHPLFTAEEEAMGGYPTIPGEAMIREDHGVVELEFPLAQ